MPHSMAALSACGALDPTDEGIYALYAVMANTVNDRPPMTPHWDMNYRAHAHDQFFGWPGIDIRAQFSKNTYARELYTTMKELQGFLREWQDELVATGVFRP